MDFFIFFPLPPPFAIVFWFCPFTDKIAYMRECMSVWYSQNAVDGGFLRALELSSDNNSYVVILIHLLPGVCVDVCECVSRFIYYNSYCYLIVTCSSSLPFDYIRLGVYWTWLNQSIP